jgi:hypothetical protein
MRSDESRFEPPYPLISGQIRACNPGSLYPDVPSPEPVLRDVILKARSPGFLEKSRTFAKSLLKDSNFVGFLRRSRLNDSDEENHPPIGYLFPVNINIFCISTPRSSQNHGDNNIHILNKEQ